MHKISPLLNSIGISKEIYFERATHQEEVELALAIRNQTGPQLLQCKKSE